MRSAHGEAPEVGDPRGPTSTEQPGGGIGTTTVRHGANVRPACGAAMLRRLRPADRAAVLDWLAELRELEVLARQRGTLAAEAVSQ